MDLRALPRSLDPLSGESLSGYILRLAHRLMGREVTEVQLVHTGAIDLPSPR